jgi:hypothetical protein
MGAWATWQDYTPEAERAGGAREGCVPGPSSVGLRQRRTCSGRVRVSCGSLRATRR